MRTFTEPEENTPMKRTTTKPASNLIRVVFYLFALISPGLTFAAKSAISIAQSNSLAPPRPKVVDTPLSREVKAATSFAPMIKKVAPSVVNIYSTMIIHDRQSSNPLSDDPIFRQFFGDQLGRQNQPQERESQGLGAGTIITPDGYILTANHVIEGAESVKVALASGQKDTAAKIIGTDPQTDVALIKIDAKDLPAAVLSDSDKLEVGDAVFAIGNPFGVGQTVTMGIVSAVGRGGFGMTGYENFIQTDAAINQGNSGGALVDAEGRLIGINTWIISGSGGNQGIGFAVPINMARYVMGHLTRDGKVTRGYIGLKLLQEITPDVARELNLPDASGALVTGVQPESPAAKAGFKEEDFIVEFNGKRISDMRHLRSRFRNHAGTKVPARVIRDGKEKILTLVVTEFPEELLSISKRAPKREHAQSGDDALDGVEVTDLDPRSRRQLGIPANVRGALVSNLEPGSPAARKGLELHDVILAINKKTVHTPTKPSP